MKHQKSIQTICDWDFDGIYQEIVDDRGLHIRKVFSIPGLEDPRDKIQRTYKQFFDDVF